MFLRLPLTLFGVLCSLCLWCQSIQHWTEHEQLSDRAVNAGLQGSDGFIWLATWNGLDRFDGYEFQRFGRNTEVALSSNYVNDLVEDQDSILWLATEDGINALDLRSYTLKVYFPKSISGSQRFVSIHCSQDGTVWAANQLGDLFAWTEGRSFENVTNPSDSLGSFGSGAILADDGKYLWLGTEANGCFQVDLKSRGIHKAHLQNTFWKVWNLGNTSGGDILIHVENQSFLYDPTGDTLVPKNWPVPESVYQNYVDYKGDQWIIGEERKQIWKLDGQGEMERLEIGQFDPGSNVHFFQFFEDHSHNLWMCSNNGLFKVTNESTRFRARYGLGDSAMNNPIPSYRGFYEDTNGDLYFCSYGGLYVCRQGARKAQKMIPNTSYGFYTLLPHTLDSLWLITEGNGVMSVHKQNFGYTTYLHPLSDQYRHKYQYFIAGFEDPKDGTFWLAGYSGVQGFDPVRRKFFDRPVVLDGKDHSQFRIKQFFVSSDQHLWLAGAEGLVELDENRKPIRWMQSGAQDYGILNGNEINSIGEGKDGSIWIGQADGGVDRLNRETGEVTNYSKESGLCDNKVGALLIDGNGHVWVATNFGLSVIHPEENLIFNYYGDDGLAHNEFNHGSALLLRSGQLLFGGVDGVSLCQPLDTLDQPQTHILLSSAEYFNESDSLVRLFGRTNIASGISLPANNQHLNIRFAYTDFLRIGRNVYTYKLEGYDKDWSFLGTQNQVRFASLPAGDYNLIVRGAGSKGSWSKEEVVIPIHVAQIFYKSPWFILAVLALFASIAWYIVRQRLEKYKELAQMRIHISSDLHDDVGSVLTRVAMQAEFIEDEVSPEQKPVLIGIVESCRTALSNMRDVVWSIDARNLDVVSLFDKINEHTTRMFENSQFTAAVHLDKGLETIPLNPTEKKELFFIFKESVHNILRHSNGDQVHVHVHHDGKFLELSIFDNGSLDANQGKAGSGLKNMEMRAESIGAQLSISTEKGFEVKVAKQIRRSWWN
ncbi:hypothetical protein KFE98_08235 [bacterium SCSIO 12741]|nr:hypothetical protein KFE98_08235 [bacterium SCSIO 12741]